MQEMTEGRLQLNAEADNGGVRIVIPLEVTVRIAEPALAAIDDSDSGPTSHGPALIAGRASPTEVAAAVKQHLQSCGLGSVGLARFRASSRRSASRPPPLAAGQVSTLDGRPYGIRRPTDRLTAQPAPASNQSTSSGRRSPRSCSFDSRSPTPIRTSPRRSTDGSCRSSPAASASTAHAAALEEPLLGTTWPLRASVLLEERAEARQGAAPRSGGLPPARPRASCPRRRPFDERCVEVLRGAGDRSAVVAQLGPRAAGAEFLAGGPRRAARRSHAPLSASRVGRAVAKSARTRRAPAGSRLRRCLHGGSAEISSSSNRSSPCDGRTRAQVELLQESASFHEAEAWVQVEGGDAGDAAVARAREA